MKSHNGMENRQKTSTQFSGLTLISGRTRAVVSTKYANLAFWLRTRQTRPPGLRPLLQDQFRTLAVIRRLRFTAAREVRR